MTFVPLELSGAYLIELEPNHDGRGFFARTWCRDELAEHGLSRRSRSAACPATNARARCGGSLPGRPHEEVKLVRCTHGGIFDVIVDLRPVRRPTARGSESSSTRSAAMRSTFRRVRPRLPDADRRGRGLLHDLDAVRTDSPAASAGTIRLRNRVARRAERTISERDRAWPDYRDARSSDLAGLARVTSPPPPGVGAAGRRARPGGSRRFVAAARRGRRASGGTAR